MVALFALVEFALVDEVDVVLQDVLVGRAELALVAPVHDAAVLGAHVLVQMAPGERGGVGQEAVVLQIRQVSYIFKPICQQSPLPLI